MDKIINIIDKDVDRTRQTLSPMVPTAKSTKTISNRTPKATTIILTSAYYHGKGVNGNPSRLPATSSSAMEYATSIKRHVYTTLMYNLKIYNTNLFKRTFSTTHNQIHKTIAKCNCSAFNNSFGVSKTVTKDTIPTVNNNNIPTHITHINGTLMKNSSKTEKRKQKSTGKVIYCELLNFEFRYLVEFKFVSLATSTF